MLNKKSEKTDLFYCLWVCYCGPTQRVAIVWMLAHEIKEKEDEMAELKRAASLVKLPVVKARRWKEGEGSDAFVVHFVRHGQVKTRKKLWISFLTLVYVVRRCTMCLLQDGERKGESAIATLMWTVRLIRI
jgi:hypothetical protein